MVGYVQFHSYHYLEDIIHELEQRGFEGPGPQVKAALDLALDAYFADTQLRTHVITASLKLSGKHRSDFDGNEWTGLITYGGYSMGPNNPVDYAIFELARGGSHDFFSGLPNFEPQFEEAIARFFDE